jgi:hypothetical protein
MTSNPSRMVSNGLLDEGRVPRNRSISASDEFRALGQFREFVQFLK